MQECLVGYASGLILITLMLSYRACFVGADGMAYLHDTCRTLAAFVRSYPPAGVPLAGMASSSLMTLLPPLHDELLPLVAAAAVAQHQAVGPPGFSSGHTASLLGQVLSPSAPTGRLGLL